MGKTIVSVTSDKTKALRISKRLNKSLKKRKIKRESYVSPVSQSYVKKLTRKGYTIRKKNYAVCVRNKRRIKRRK